MNIELIKGMGVTFIIMFVWYLLYNKLEEEVFSQISSYNSAAYGVIAAAWMAAGFMICAYFVWDIAYDHRFGRYHLIFIVAIVTLTTIVYIFI
jgi:hypothetical protein